MLRFAPSPIGDMHIANLHIAILNYVVAQQKNEQFLIRIEDNGSKEDIKGKDTEIMMILEKFALKHNTVFHQSEHLNLHQTLALRLLKEGKAFVCKCTDEALKSDEKHHYSGECENLTQDDYIRLKESGASFRIRIKKPNINIRNHDLLKGEITTTPEEIDSFIILQTDGTPTYNFACASDDMMNNINFIIRGEEHLFNTPKQIHIKNLLGYENETQYAHLPTILNSNGQKISNTDNEYSVKWLFKEGFIPDAILNYLLLLGNSKAPKKIFTLPEAITWFDLTTISRSAIKFDIDALRFINREHLKRMNSKQLSTLFGFADADIGDLAKVYLQECSTIKELETKIHSIFTAKNFEGELGLEMKTVAKIIAQAPAFETFDQFKQHIMNKSNIEDKNFLKSLRYLMTGTNNGPELSEIYPFIKSYILEVAS